MKKTKLSEQEAKNALESGIAYAKKVLEDTAKLERLLNKLDLKALKEDFSKLTLLVEIVRAYVKKEYTKIPTRSILAILSAIIYVVNPFDIIPDILPGVGHVDDLSVLLFCLKMVAKDIDEYLLWKENNAIVAEETSGEEALCSLGEVE